MVHLVGASAVIVWQRPGLWSIACQGKFGPDTRLGIDGDGRHRKWPLWCADVVRLGSPCMVKKLESIRLPLTV